MKTYQDRDEYNFGSYRLAASAQQIGNLDTWEVSRGALMSAHPNKAKKNIIEARSRKLVFIGLHDPNFTVKFNHGFFKFRPC